MDDVFYSYTDQELACLKQKDEALAGAIMQIGRIERTVIPDLFSALVNSIVGQQISSAAHRTVWARLMQHYGDITPDALLSGGADALRECGLSGRKAEYILNAAEKVKTGQLDLNALGRLPDEAVIDALVQLRGVGRWTAEMLLIFSLQRRDVMSYADFGIRKGIKLLYGLSELTQAQFDAYRRRFSPYGSLASLYLWAIAARPVKLTRRSE